ncbi:unnamed protein product [Thelazia callipaeda]|uniref:Uncharacterized protein n=1 Tax=Thelazia callipaeda TaxID=103827 RepID=A0A0N5CPZ7_THECL|nr:unnamed protein product [Thelazia callipaeda]
MRIVDPILVNNKYIYKLQLKAMARNVYIEKNRGSLFLVIARLCQIAEGLVRPGAFRKHEMEGKEKKSATGIINENSRENRCVGKSSVRICKRMLQSLALHVVHTRRNESYRRQRSVSTYLTPISRKKENTLHESKNWKMGGGDGNRHNEYLEEFVPDYEVHDR